MSKKITRGWKIEPISLDVPATYMDNHNQVKKEDKGLYKLKARNDKLHNELVDLAALYNSKVSTFKVGDRIIYTLKGLNITVSLVNT